MVKKWIIIIAIAIIVLGLLLNFKCLYKKQPPANKNQPVENQNPKDNPKDKPTKKEKPKPSPKPLEITYTVNLSSTNSDYGGSFSLAISKEVVQRYKYQLISTSVEDRLETGDFREDFKKLIQRDQERGVVKITVIIQQGGRLILQIFKDALADFLEEQNFEKTHVEIKHEKVISKTFTWEKPKGEFVKKDNSVH